MFTPAWPRFAPPLQHIRFHSVCGYGGGALVGSHRRYTQISILHTNSLDMKLYQTSSLV
jgi:hypothetical protein